MVWYRGCWRRMQNFFAARGVGEFSLDVAMAWVDEACGFFGKEQAGSLKPNDIYLIRVAQMLGEYAAHGAVLRRYNRSVSKLSGDGAETVARFQAWLRAADRAASTVRTYGTVAGEFVAFTGTRGGLARCDAATIGAFVATLAGYQVKTVEQKLGALRSFLRFASADGLVDAACLVAVPAAPSIKQARIPSVWDPGEVARIVEAIDRDNPCGKRDYAIILLITRLGLRGVDVRRLEFADFDWPGNRLFVTQAKTGHRVQLPLLKEVGWAVIDYIRHGRPAAARRFGLFFYVVLLVRLVLLEAQRLRFVCSATRRTPSRYLSKSRLDRPWPWVTMQKRCAPAASAARACWSTCSGSIIACIGVSASANRDWAQKPQSSAQPPDLAFTSEHMSVESPNRSTRASQARSTSASICS